MTLLFLALDDIDYLDAFKILNSVDDLVDGIKIRPDFIIRHGLKTAHVMRDRGAHKGKRKLFIDAKIADTPRSTYADVHAYCSYDTVDYLTINAGDSDNSMAAAKNAAKQLKVPPMLLAVGVLTTVSDNRTIFWERIYNACAANMDGFIAPPWALEHLRQNYPHKFLMTPGIRMAGSKKDEHESTMTPREAVETGADAIVVGSEVLNSANPRATLLKIRVDMAGVRPYNPTR